MNNVDKEYFRLINVVLTNGKIKKNRTGVDTIGVFGEQAKFDINLDAFPILTTKKVFFRGILHELLWFIKGDTNIKYLVDNDVHIWDEWAAKRYFDKNGSEVINTQEEFIQKIKDDAEFAQKCGELGEGTYGGMWRAFPFYQESEIAEGPIYSDGFGNTSRGKIVTKGTVDQLKKVVEKLKTNPDDRRMIISAWHPYWVDHCALPPCHCLFHFNTEELTHEERVEIVRKRNPGVSSFTGKGGVGSLEVVSKEEGWLDGNFYQQPVPKRRLNCLLYQRSCDLGLGVPFNITSYCLLTAMVAHVVNMVPGVFTHTYGDLHIYENHFDALKQQVQRESMSLPKLWINPDVKDLFSLKFDDIKLIDYKSHSTIKMDVAV